MYTLGYVDEDAYEIRRYKKQFKQAGFNVIDYDIQPGMSIETLIDKVYKSEIDLLMVDYLLNEKGVLGYNGDKVIREFEKVRPDFPKLIFTSRESQALPYVDDPNIIYDKSDIQNDKEHFLKIINRNIEKYLNNINEKKSLINELIEKRETIGIDAKEKEELFSIQYELSNLDQRTKETPNHLMTDLKLDELSSTIEDAEELLSKLKKDSE